MASGVDLLRALVTDAVDRRPSPRTGRLRVTVVGQDEVAFLVDLLPTCSRVCDDDNAPADASLWLAAHDVPHTLKGFLLNGARQAGDAALLATFMRLLEPGTTPLQVRLGGGRDG